MVNAKLDWRKFTPQQLVDKAKAELEADKLSEEDTAKLVLEVIKAQPKVVADYKGGKENAVKFLLGQVMVRSKGQADPAVSLKLLHQNLDN